MRQHYLFAYDITCPRRQACVRRLLQSYAVGMQKSLFECWLTADELTKLTVELIELLDTSDIRSIGQQYLNRVEESVWRSVNAGYDMAQLTRELRRDYGISERRAAFIARDQTNKAKAAIEKARRQELGITEAIWMHSHAGKEPRPSHVAANGKRFDVSKGMYLDGKWVQPGEEINCRCTSRAVIKGFNS